MKKAFCLDENYLFPICNQCHKELTPYSISSDELNKQDIRFTESLIQCDLIRVNAIDKNIHVIFLCSNCIKLKKDRL